MFTSLAMGNHSDFPPNYHISKLIFFPMSYLSGRGSGTQLISESGVMYIIGMVSKLIQSGKVYSDVMTRRDSASLFVPNAVPDKL